MNSARLEDLCEAIVDCPHSTPRWANEGIPVIRNFNLENTVISLNNPSYVDEEGYRDRTRRAEPCEGDLILSREAPMGRVGLVPAGLKCCLGQRLVLLRPNRKLVDPRYLLIAMTSEYVQTQIRRADIAGSIVSNLSLPQIRDLKIPLIEDANDAASLLGTIDDKIALNKRLCAELEKTARLVYDYWFTQFDFPNENGRPYRSSGGKMTYSDVVKSEVPEGWVAVRVGDLVTVVKGISYKSDDLVGEGTPMVSLASFNADGSYKPEAIKSYSGKVDDKRSARHGDLIMCVTQQTAIDLTGKTNVIGKALLVPDIFPGDIVISTDVAKLVPREPLHSYVLEMLFKRMDIHKHVVGYANGTKIKHLDVEGALDFYISMPATNQGVLSTFAQMRQKQIAQCSELLKECDELIKLRDQLLPMLMNGQVKIGTPSEIDESKE